MSSDGVGMILSVRGNHEYEVDRASGHTQLTLVRGVGILGIGLISIPTIRSVCVKSLRGTLSSFIRMKIDPKR